MRIICTVSVILLLIGSCQKSNNPANPISSTDQHSIGLYINEHQSNKQTCDYTHSCTGTNCSSCDLTITNNGCKGSCSCDGVANVNAGTFYCTHAVTSGGATIKTDRSKPPITYHADGTFTINYDLNPILVSGFKSTHPKALDTYFDEISVQKYDFGYYLVGKGKTYLQDEKRCATVAIPLSQ